jgi:hypothetical protein
MFRSKRRLAVLVLILLAGGWLAWAVMDWLLTPGQMPPIAWRALKYAERFEFLSLNPKELWDQPNAGFHGFQELGRQEITESQVRKNLADALYTAVNDYHGPAAGCFNPRHGIHLLYGGQTVDLVICFECYQVQCYVEGEYVNTFKTGRTAQPAFDQVLRDAGVPLPPPAK